jgi:hypothetical protein
MKVQLKMLIYIYIYSYIHIFKYTYINTGMNLLHLSKSDESSGKDADKLEIIDIENRVFEFTSDLVRTTIMSLNLKDQNIELHKTVAEYLEIERKNNIQILMSEKYDSERFGLDIDDVLDKDVYGSKKENDGMYVYIYLFMFIRTMYTCVYICIYKYEIWIRY